MSPRWLFFPTQATATLEVATATGWTLASSHYTSQGWSAGTYGAGTTKLVLRGDNFGAFLFFTNNTTRDAWMTANQGSNLRVTDSNSNIYEWSGGTISVFTTAILTLGPAANWSGNFPTASLSNSTTIELYS